jgi:hypothetical protein
LEGLSKETVVRTERKIFFQTLYWISILRAFGVVRRNSCPKRKKNFLADFVLDFYFKSLWGCQKKQLSEKKEKFSCRHCAGFLFKEPLGLSEETVVRKERKIFFQTLYWIFILRTLKGQLSRRGCQKKQLSEKKEKFSFRHCTGFLF